MLTRRGLLAGVIASPFMHRGEKVTNQLNQTKTVTFNAAGTATATLSPSDFPGTSSWHVTGVLTKTSRPGLAPIPTIDVYLNDATPDNIVGTSYDGSRNAGACDITLNTGMRIVAVWTGGQAGDIGYLTLTGERS